MVILKHKSSKTYSTDFLNFTHAHIPAEAQTYATLPYQNLKGERGGGWVDNSISNQNPIKFYPTIDLWGNKI